MKRSRSAGSESNFEVSFGHPHDLSHGWSSTPVHRPGSPDTTYGSHPSMASCHPSNIRPLSPSTLPSTGLHTPGMGIMLEDPTSSTHPHGMSCTPPSCSASVPTQGMSVSLPNYGIPTSCSTGDLAYDMINSTATALPFLPPSDMPVLPFGHMGESGHHPTGADDALRVPGNLVSVQDAAPLQQVDSVTGEYGSMVPFYDSMSNHSNGVMVGGPPNQSMPQNGDVSGGGAAHQGSYGFVEPNSETMGGIGHVPTRNVDGNMGGSCDMQATMKHTGEPSRKEEQVLIEQEQGQQHGLVHQGPKEEEEMTSPRTAASTCASCGRCGEKFDSEESLKAHDITVHQGRFLCDECPLSYARNSDLLKHLRTVHNRQKPFSCDLCSVKFGQKHHLRRHQRNVHDKERNFKCQSCQACFARKEQLKSHIRTVHEAKTRNDGEGGGEITGDMKFVCFLCDSRFIDKDGLKDHFDKIHCVKKSRLDVLVGWQPDCGNAPWIEEILQM